MGTGNVGSRSQFIGQCRRVRPSAALTIARATACRSTSAISGSMRPRSRTGDQTGRRRGLVSGTATITSICFEFISSACGKISYARQECTAVDGFALHDGVVKGAIEAVIREGSDSLRVLTLTAHGGEIRADGPSLPPSSISVSAFQSSERGLATHVGELAAVPIFGGALVVLLLATLALLVLSRRNPDAPRSTPCSPA